jgi:hypothetical protein
MLGRRPALLAVLAAAAAAAPPRRPVPRGSHSWAPWPRGPRLRLSDVARGRTPAAARAPPYLPWRAVLELVRAGGPNRRLGLVQGQHIFVRGGGYRLLRNGLIRVRIPWQFVDEGEAAWARDRFDDGWWMAVLRRLGVPFKAVVELSRRATDEQHAAHAIRLVQRCGPDAVIVGNELNAVDLRPRVDAAAEIERYLDRYAAIHAAVRAEAPATQIQLYGEAYDGDPRDRGAFLRRVLAALRRRGLPPPDTAGIHVYDPAEALPARVAGYRRLLADFGLTIPVAVEELGPRQGVIDRFEAGRLADQPARDAGRYASRLAEVHGHGWLTESEHAELVPQQLATAAASADQAQIFCAIDFADELHTRRGLVSGEYDRPRPALEAFAFTQRLLNEPAEIELTSAAEQGGVATVRVVRRDGLTALVHWSAPAGGEGGEGGAPARSIPVPAYTWVCDARGELVLAPQAYPQTLVLPAATTAEAGGAVRIFL